MNEPSLFVLLRRSFWGFFGAIWLVGGSLFFLIGLGRAILYGEYGIMLVLGAVLAGIGGVLFRKGLREARRELRLLREGTPAEGTVTGVMETNIRFNKRRMWVIGYRYTDQAGRTHEGRSGYLDPEEAVTWRAGDTGAIRFDPQNPSDSIWIGKPS